MTEQSPSSEHITESLNNEALARAAEAFLDNPLTKKTIREDGSITQELSTSKLSSFSPIDIELTTDNSNGEVSTQVTLWDAVGLDNEVYSWSTKAGETNGNFHSNGSREISREMTKNDYAAALNHINAAYELFKNHKPTLKMKAAKNLGILIGRRGR